MKAMQYVVTSLVLVVLAFDVGYAQNHRYYLRAIDKNQTIELANRGDRLVYSGSSAILSSIFNEKDVLVFKKAFPNSRRDDLQRVYYMESTSDNLLDIFLRDGAAYFDYGEYLGNQSILLANTYPNDYGQTGPQDPGYNLGFNLNLSAFDYADLPRAWDFTTGELDIKIGISDAKVDLNDLEFAGKIVSLINSGSYENGHGIGVTAIAAAQGDNGNANVGYCSDCSIIHTSYTEFYDGILALSYAGARVVNCSWRFVNAPYSQLEQQCIDEATENGTIVVGASGNENWSDYGPVITRPASYNNVISVGSVGSKYQTPVDSTYLNPGNSMWRANNVKNHLAHRIQFTSNPNTNPNAGYFLLTVHTGTLNPDVDILAPMGAYRYGMIAMGIPPHPIHGYYAQEATSPAAPQVSGTIGLMSSLVDCLSFNEVESILKITSTFIGDIQANNIVNGNYGSGGLNAGRAVELTSALSTVGAVAYLENQKFSRWDFTFNGISDSIVVRNQEFTGVSSLEINAKNAIVIEEETLIEFDPEVSEPGYAVLEIDGNLVICPPGTKRPENSRQKAQLESQEDQFKVYPNTVREKTSVTKINSTGFKIARVDVFNILGLRVMNFDDLNTYSATLNLSGLSTGIYILKGYDSNNQELFTKKIIKE